MPEKRHEMLQQKDVYVSCGFLPVTFAVRRRLSSCARNVGFLAVWSCCCVPQPDLELHAHFKQSLTSNEAPSPVLPLPSFPWAHPGPEKRYRSSASHAARAEASERPRSVRGGSGSFSRSLRPCGNHHFPENLFRARSFR